MVMKYVALLRGIGPGNPNMTNEKLRSVFEGLGFGNVQSVISSGNILFESDETDIAALEKRVEETFPIKLGFTPTTIIKSQDQLQKMVKLGPFKGYTHGPTSYLLVTFFKGPTKIPFAIPYQPKDKPYKFIASNPTTLFSVTNNTVLSTTDLMGWMEKQFSKQITSRTWLTIQRILKKMG